MPGKTYADMYTCCGDMSICIKEGVFIKEGVIPVHKDDLIVNVV
jgi:hypothetical protein